jgi:ACS family hexuronate transporter-like MFS transporter
MSHPAPSTGRLPPLSAAKPTNFRWVICGLLFYATTVNYIDRSTLNTLEPTLRDVIHWRPYQYGLINAVFSLAYGIGFLVMALIVERIGVRAGYALAMIGWSISGMLTAFTGNPIQFGITRFLLGLFEAGNFPAAIKTIAEWFPQKQRATATGIFNAGSNVGAVCAPLIVLLLVPFFGWRSAFFVTPILVLIWVGLWLSWYRAPVNQPRANDAERALIEADPIVKAAPVKWRNILPHPQAWAFMAGKFFTDPIWWFYLFWSGAFFNDKFHVKLSGLALPRHSSNAVGPPTRHARLPCSSARSSSCRSSSRRSSRRICLTESGSPPRSLAAPLQPTRAFPPTSLPLPPTCSQNVSSFP